MTNELGPVTLRPTKYLMDHLSANPVDIYADLSGVPRDAPELQPAQAVCNELVENPIVGKYRRFLPIAQAFAQMSKDTSTKVGAIVLGTNFEVRSSGWNGAPRGSRADVDERAERPEKYQWFSHAEMNAIAQAAMVGSPLNGCVMIITHAPCMICARLIVQAGIERVVCPKPTGEFAERWAEDLTRMRRLFDECGVYLIELEEGQP